MRILPVGPFDPMVRSGLRSDLALGDSIARITLIPLDPERPPYGQRDRLTRDGEKLNAIVWTAAAGRSRLGELGKRQRPLLGIIEVMWPTSPAALIAAQRELATASPTQWRAGEDAPAIGACAVCFARGQTGPGAQGDRAWAAAAVLRGRRVLAHANVISQAGAPYGPGLLALREGICLEASVRSLELRPDVLLVDATARDHPRRAGLALQIGAVLDLPTIGVTHRPLLAQGVWPADIPGAIAPLLLEGERVGAWLRTRRRARPLAIHGGWRTDVDLAIQVVLMATFDHRTPEPFRHARMLARTARACG